MENADVASLIADVPRVTIASGGMLYKHVWRESAVRQYFTGKSKSYDDVMKRLCEDLGILYRFMRPNSSEWLVRLLSDQYPHVVNMHVRVVSPPIARESALDFSAQCVVECFSLSKNQRSSLLPRLQCLVDGIRDGDEGRFWCNIVCAVRMQYRALGKAVGFVSVGNGVVMSVHRIQHYQMRGKNMTWHALVCSIGMTEEEERSMMPWREGEDEEKRMREKAEQMVRDRGTKEPLRWYRIEWEGLPTPSGEVWAPPPPLTAEETQGSDVPDFGAWKQMVSVEGEEVVRIVGNGMLEEEEEKAKEETLALLASKGKVSSKSAREDLDKLEQLMKKAEQVKSASKLPSTASGQGGQGPRLLKAGGQGYRMWKSSHEHLIMEMSSRTPPMPEQQGVMSPRFRNESQRYEDALKATVGALDVSEKAGRVMQELLNSEREYFTDLGMLQRLYVKPLSEGAKQKGGMVTERDLGDLFSNFDDIFKLNLDLLRRLEVELKKPQSQQDAGQLFLDFADKFQVYAIYCANANAAKKRMEALAMSNKRFAEFCEKARSHSAHKGLDIGSFLIKPLQRLCQYPLLLRELLEALPDQQNAPYARLQQAYKVMCETVDTVNGMLKSIRKRTELQRLNDLMSFDGFRSQIVHPDRKFSFCAAFRVRSVYPGEKESTSKKMKNWDVWLLSDMIVMGEREKTKTSDHLTVKAWMPLELCTVVEQVGGAMLPPQVQAMQQQQQQQLEGSSKRLSLKTVKLDTKRSDLGDNVCVSVAGGAQFFLCADEKTLTMFMKKLNKKLTKLKSH